MTTSPQEIMDSDDNETDENASNDSTYGGVEWTNQLAKELHKPIRRKFQKRRVFTPAVNWIWACDLADLSMYSRFNRGYKYILCVIDTFSKYGYMIPMKSKNAEETAKAFENLFKSEKDHPKFCWMDKGSEFWNKKVVENVMKKYGVKMYTTENEEKSCIVERWIRTMKSIMFRYFTAARTKNYISVLPKMVLKYNNSYHRSIKCTPTQAKIPVNYQSVFDSLYPPLKPPTKAVFKIGDVVRIVRKKGKFEKGFLPNFTEELFKVAEIRSTNPITYKLNDLEGETVIGSFYKQDLQKSTQNVYFIEKILKRRVRNGVKEVYVKWSGYSDRFNQWIPAGDVIDTKEQREKETEE